MAKFRVIVRSWDSLPHAKFCKNHLRGYIPFWSKVQVTLWSCVMAVASGAPSARRLGQGNGCVPPCLVGGTGRIYRRPLRGVWTHGWCSATSVCSHGRCGARCHPSHPPSSAGVCGCGCGVVIFKTIMVPLWYHNCFENYTASWRFRYHKLRNSKAWHKKN